MRRAGRTVLALLAAALAVEAAPCAPPQAQASRPASQASAAEKPHLQAPQNGAISCDFALSSGTYPEGTVCTFSCDAQYSLGSLWSWSRYTGEGRYGDTEIGADQYGGTESPQQHPQMYNFRSKSDGTYEAGPRVALDKVSQRTCQADGSWSGKDTVCWNTQKGQACVHSVFPKCGPRTSQIGPETQVTILGQNFGPDPPAVTFNDGNVLKDGIVKAFSANQIVVSIPPYPEHNEEEFPFASYTSRDDLPYPHQMMNKTKKGAMLVKNGGIPVQDCRDVDYAHARRLFPFTYAVGWPANPPLYATDFAQNRIVEIDPDTGITVTRIDHVDGFPIRKPYGIDIGPDGALYVANGHPSVILRYNITGQFLGVWANVPGEPRGIRWLDDQLYVCSWNMGRVLHYRHHAARANFNKPKSMEHNVGSYRGPFTQAMTSEVPGGVTSNKLYELRFHSIDGQRKLFVSSAESGHLLQFNGFNGLFERKFTSHPVPSITGFAFSYTKANNDLFATGYYNGRSITRYDGQNGTMISHFKHEDLQSPGGMVSHDDSLYVTSMEEVRQHSISTGRLIRISTLYQGAAFNFITVAGQCN